MLTVKFLLLSLFLCLCKGGPPKGVKIYRDTPDGRIRIDLYSREEELFIIEELISYARTYDCYTTWRRIAAAMEKKRETDTPGFSQKRTSVGIHHHFFYYMMKNDRPEDAVRVPDYVKKIVGKPRKKFTKQEDDFVNEKLLLAPVGSKFSTAEFWTEVAKEHKEIWKTGNKHFPSERTKLAFLKRFERLRNTDKINQKVKRKHADRFYFNKGSSRRRMNMPALTEEPAPNPSTEDMEESDKEFCEYLEQQVGAALEQAQSDREFCDFLEKELEEASGQAESDRELCDQD